MAARRGPPRRATRRPAGSAALSLLGPILAAAMVLATRPVAALTQEWLTIFNPPWNTAVTTTPSTRLSAYTTGAVGAVNYTLAPGSSGVWTGVVGPLNGKLTAFDPGARAGAERACRGGAGLPGHEAGAGGPRPARPAGAHLYPPP
jgi:hypothetical protein